MVRNTTSAASIRAERSTPSLGPDPVLKDDVDRQPGINKSGATQSAHTPTPMRRSPSSAAPSSEGAFARTPGSTRGSPDRGRSPSTDSRAERACRRTSHAAKTTNGPTHAIVALPDPPSMDAKQRPRGHPCPSSRRSIAPLAAPLHYHALDAIPLSRRRHPVQPSHWRNVRRVSPRWNGGATRARSAHGRRDRPRARRTRRARTDRRLTACQHRRSARATQSRRVARRRRAAQSVRRPLRRGAEHDERAIVNVDERTLETTRDVPGVEPRLDGVDADAAEAMTRANEAWRRALARRGLSPHDVTVMAWAAGNFGGDEDPSRGRLVRALTSYARHRRTSSRGRSKDSSSLWTSRGAAYSTCRTRATSRRRAPRANAMRGNRSLARRRGAHALRRATSPPFGRRESTSTATR